MLRLKNTNLYLNIYKYIYFQIILNLNSINANKMIKNWIQFDFEIGLT